MLWDLERPTDEYRESKPPGKEVCQPEGPVRWCKRKAQLQLQSCWRVSVEKPESHKLPGSLVIKDPAFMCALTSRPGSTSSGNTMCLFVLLAKKRGRNNSVLKKVCLLEKQCRASTAGTNGGARQTPDGKHSIPPLWRPLNPTMLSAPRHRLT